MRQSPLKVLIVDDEPTNVSIIENSLEGQGYDIQVASSGETALTKAEAFKPDLVLLDIMLPGMDGYEVARQMRLKEGLKYTKTLMVSAKAMLNERIKGYSCGANDYVVKPFESEELLAKVKSFEHLKFEAEIEDFKSKMMRIMSHEIRSPLNGILGFANLLDQAATLNPTEKSFLSKIIQSGNSLLSLSERYLLMYELKKGPDLHYNTIVLDDIVKEAVEKSEHLVVQSKLKIITTLEKDKSIVADAGWVELAIRFVLEHALRATKPGGFITISSVPSQAETEQLWIRDQSKGIDQKQAEKMFDEFAIEDQVLEEEGGGIGLSLARLIAREHGGDLMLAHNSSDGCIFVFTFPKDARVSLGRKAALGK